MQAIDGFILGKQSLLGLATRIPMKARDPFLRMKFLRIKKKICLVCFKAKKQAAITLEIFQIDAPKHSKRSPFPERDHKSIEVLASPEVVLKEQKGKSKATPRCKLRSKRSAPLFGDALKKR